MDPAHRDRIAFVRVASGHFERGMRLKVVRSGKELRPNTVVSFLSQRRELLDEAFAGDIIGIPNHGVLQLGDTLTEGEALQFTGLPFFAPEMFRCVEVADPLRTKQLRAGLTQLGEEGAIQVFRPVAGSVLLLGAVGQLQFEVVAHRLEHEYGVKARILPSALPGRALGDLRARGRRRQGAAALHRRQRAPRRLRRGRCADRAGRVRAGAARDRERTGRRSSSTRCASTRGWCSSSGSTADGRRDRAGSVRAPFSDRGRGRDTCLSCLSCLVPAAVAARVLVRPALTHPFVANEVDRLAAGAVAAAVAAPVLLVRRRDAQVDRLLVVRRRASALTITGSGQHRARAADVADV